MNYSTFLPPELLTGYVRFFWVLESEEPDHPFVHRTMADSCTELLFHYSGTFTEIDSNGLKNDTFLSGLHSQSHTYRRFSTNEKFGIFGAYLYPYAAKQLLNLSPAELTNQMPDLHTALGNEGKELEEKMMLAAGNTDRYNILSNYLEKKLLSKPEDHHPAKYAVKYVIHSENLSSVEDLAQQFNLSERQFVRKFKEYSGLTPKLFMRIVRFEGACRKYGSTGKRSLTEIAQECGYYDQSHFIRDFKEFSGYEPGRYFSGNAEGTQWRE